ncbi:FecR family protein [Pseudoflavitalea rhizosphaerae]|uniref:FecR family protein n=1 Tax=Pseudoflavitalea rhizosphaerae TaxID=1884793 RepID=UPI000F8F44EF|nr:FecR domain-containing protein [Pseudoflavitalea rhizosphaerae]
MKLSQEHIRRLLVEKMAGTISEEDEQSINEEMERNPAVKARWEAMKKVMKSREGEDFMNKLDANSSWQAVSGKILDGPPANIRKIRFYKRLTVAAAAIVLVSSGLYIGLRKEDAGISPLANQPVLPAATPDSLQYAVGLYLEDGRQINLSDSAGRVINLGSAALNTSGDGLQLQAAKTGKQEWTTVSVPPKLDYRIVLADGSEVWLNAASSLKFPLHFADSVREVFVKGEAFFRIAKNAAQPFIVHSDAADIRVLGTSFNVHAYHSGKAIVSLVEGAVKTKMQGQQTETTLKPGLEAVIDAAERTQVRQFKSANTLAWMKGVYYFHDTPLSEIGEVLQRWFGLTLVYSDPSLAKLPVTGAIEKNQPLTDFLTSLQTAAGIQTEIRQNQLHIIK